MDAECYPSLVLYFDHNATHPLTPTARAAWLDAVERFPANPSSPHRLGQRAEKALDEARERLAAILGCQADEIVFTSGATESANMALAPFTTILHSAIEHPCVREAARGRSREFGVNRSGVADLEDLRRQLADHAPAVVALMAANNETGALQPWREALEICRGHRVPFFCDAAQWIGKLPARGLGECDLVSGCAHKFGGPLGAGFLKCRRDFPPLLRGGPQEDGRRGGTENLPAILAMLAALEEAEERLASPISSSLTEARDQFETRLTAALPGVQILAAETPRLWNTVSVLMPETPDCRRRWVVVLDRLGFAVSTGSACASGKEKPSHVLTAMGVAPSDAGRALRFSAGWSTTEKEWESLRHGLETAVREMR